ncbi:MAG: hypothetical protein WC469_05755 [Candidatus Omnitrophota bacterium]|jgi:hypothetical protein
MEDKESPNLLDTNIGTFKAKFSTFGSRMFGLFKLSLGVVMLVFVYSFSRSFLYELGLVESEYQRYFWSGVISMLLFYLFVWEPAIIYNKGYRLVELLFNFFKPLVRVAPYLLPIYTIVLFLAFVVLFYIFQLKDTLGYFVFLFGLTIALHLIFSAKTIRGKKGDFLKSNYVFGFSFIYILNVFMLALILGFIFNKFSIVDFLGNSFQIAASIFKAVFRQLFL